MPPTTTSGTDTNCRTRAVVSVAARVPTPTVVATTAKPAKRPVTPRPPKMGNGVATPERLGAGPRLVAGQHAREHGVVPVHGPAVLRGEVRGAAGDDIAEAGRRQLPVGALVAELFGDGNGAAQ